MFSGAGAEGWRYVAAIVLAAGFSSRMGVFKPLLPFGGRALIGHVVSNFRQADVCRIHVVTGFNAEALTPEVTKLGVTAIHNPDFAKGMLSSVQVGIASLPPETEALLLAPVGVPLLRPSTIRRVLAASASSGAAIVYPAYRGERGHPPLIRRIMFDEILAYTGEGGLQALVARHAGEAVNVDVFDWGCLADMDRPEDYRRLVAALERHRAPDAEECEAMLGAAAAPEPVRRHCRAVAALAANLARRLNDAGEPVDEDFTRAAAWLHDIAKGRPQHAEAGAAMVSEFGFPELAEAIASHTDYLFDGGRISETALVYFADKLVQGGTRVSLEDRFAPALKRFASDPAALAGAARRFANAKSIRDAIEARIGRLDQPNEPIPEAMGAG